MQEWASLLQWHNWKLHSLNSFHTHRHTITLTCLWEGKKPSTAGKYWITNGVNGSEMRGKFWPTSPVGCIPSPWQRHNFTVLPCSLAEPNPITKSKLFLGSNKEALDVFPDLPPSSPLFLLSPFSLLPSLSPLCTQECFVGSWDKRNKRCHWQKPLRAHPCVCGHVWLCESGTAITCVFFWGMLL